MNILESIDRALSVKLDEGVSDIKYSKQTEREGGDTMIRYDAHVDSENIAYAALRPKSTEGDGPWFSGLYVSPEYRGKGISSELMRRIENDHRGQTIRLRARPYKDKGLSKSELIKIYRSWGFREYDSEGRMKKEL